MLKLNYIFIGGKQLGYNCLSLLIKKKLYPKYVIPNLDDTGKDTKFHKSLLKLCWQNKLNLISQDKLSRKIIQNKKIKIDIIFCLGSTQILKENIMSLGKLGVLNLHPSLLPKYRGRYSLVHAIFDNQKETGVTAHWLGKEIDSGRIIKQKKFSILKTDTAKDVYDKFTIKAFKLFKIILNEILMSKRIKSYPMKNKMKYNKKSFPNQGSLNWNWNSKKIYNFIRAMIFEPFQPPHFMIGKKKYFIVSETYLNKKLFIKSPK